MNIINESQPEFRQKIGSYLEQCAPSSQSISLEHLTNILPLSLRELAWMVAICEGKHPYVSIPWEDDSLRDRVEVLNNIFLNVITEEITDNASAKGLGSLTADSKRDAVYKLMGIQWEIAHDYNGKGIPTYNILSINDTEKLKSILIRLLSGIRAKIVTPSLEPIQMAPWVKSHNMALRSNQIFRLLDNICFEQPIRINLEKINKPIQSYNLAWLIVICNKRLNWIEDVKIQELDITPLAEITNEKIINYLQELKSLHKLKLKCFDEVDLRSSGTVKKLMSYEIPADLVLKVIANNSIYKINPPPKIDSATNQVNHFIDSSITVQVNVFSTEQSKMPSESPAKYEGNDINIAVVTVILPKLLPDKKKLLNNKDKGKLCLSIFEQLTDVLKKNGADVTDNLPQSNKKDMEINGTDKNGEVIKISYEALEKRVKKEKTGLLQAYKYNLQPEIQNI